MKQLQHQIEEARYQWQQEIRYDFQLGERWEQLSWMLFAGDQRSLVSGIQKVKDMGAFDALCTLIELDEKGVIHFIESAPSYGRDMAGKALLQLAVEAPMGHILQELLIVGALDHMLIMGLEHLGIDAIPDWAHERVLSTLSAMIRIEASEHWIGNPYPNAFEDEQPQQSVILHNYEMGAYPVTQALYRVVCQEFPSTFNGASRPVESVSWLDALRFCNAISEHSNLEPVYSFLGDEVQWNRYANGYRLPTELEWEAAARAGENFRYAGGDDLARLGWFQSAENSETHGVGLKRSNAWGLYDMSGLIYEWCWDGYGPYPQWMQDNYSNEVQGGRKVRRGGSWMSKARACEIWCRSDRGLHYRSENTGFRLGRTI